MAYTIKSVLEALPVGRTRGTGTSDMVDYTEETVLINEIPDGKVLEIEFGDKSEFRAFSAKIRAAGRRVNKKVEATFHKGKGDEANSVYLTAKVGVEKVTRKRRSKEEIAAAKAEAEAAKLAGAVA